MSLQQLLGTAWTPQPYLVYKPTKKSTGSALRLQLRLEPTWEEKDGYARPNMKGNGGLFLELAAQTGFSDGNASFGWGEPTLVRAKLGLQDVMKLLAAIREVRVSGHEVPASLRGKTGDAWMTELFHQFDGATTIISMKFEAERSIVRIGKSKDLYRSIVLDLHEERGFERYLELALEGFLRVGVR